MKFLTVLVVVWAAAAVTAQTDLGVDVVTRATTLNPMEGDVAVLTDGLTPENAADAAAVRWSGVGMLRVEWPETVPLATIRVYAGLAERYSMYAYVGGSFNVQGQRLEVLDTTYTREGLAPLDENIWFEIACDPEVPIDNLGLIFVGNSVIYEIQFLGPAGTAIEPASLGLLKARRRPAFGPGSTH